MNPGRGLGAGPEKVLVIGSLGWSLVNFRLDLMRRMRAQGHEVIAAAPELGDDVVAALAAEGIRAVSLPMERTGLNPLSDIATFAALLRLIRAEAPTLVVPYTMKPIVYGCLAAQVKGVRAVPLFTGLGYAFAEPNPRGRRRGIRAIVVALHRLATRRVGLAFCYNQRERDDLRAFRLVPNGAEIVEVAGSGVETTRFAPQPLPPGEPSFIFVGRMLRSKGVADLIAAARLLRAEGLAPRVTLVGATDANPDAVTEAELAAWHAGKEAEVLGPTRDVRSALGAASVLVLPSRLREGIPRAILEAMACGRAVITSDAPGCGETVVDGVTGLVVPQGDVPALAAAMRRMMAEPALVRAMGAAGRARVCARHDVHDINRELLTRLGLEAPATEPLRQERQAGESPLLEAVA